MEGQYSLRSPAVKRLMREAQELREPTEEYFAQPLEDNLFEWHFTVRGPPETEFDGGLYHGRVILPPDYPMKPPSIILLTPNGRFETNKKICLSISGHHPESWQPSWSLRTALLAIIGFMPTHGSGAIASLDYTPEERKVLAKKSQNWSCSVCGPISKLVLERTEASGKISSTQQEARDLVSQLTSKKDSETSKPAEQPQGAQADQTSEASPTAPEPTNDLLDEAAIRRRVIGDTFAETVQRTEVQATRAQNQEFKVLYNAAIWAVGTAFIVLLIRRLLFL